MCSPGFQVQTPIVEPPLSAGDGPGEPSRYNEGRLAGVADRMSSISNRLLDVTIVGHRPSSRTGWRGSTSIRPTHFASDRHRRDRAILDWCAEALRASADPRHLEVGCAYGNLIFMLREDVRDLPVSASTVSISTMKRSSSPPPMQSDGAGTRLLHVPDGPISPPVCRSTTHLRQRVDRRCDRAPRVSERHLA